MAVLLRFMKRYVLKIYEMFIKVNNCRSNKSHVDPFSSVIVMKWKIILIYSHYTCRIIVRMD